MYVFTCYLIIIKINIINDYHKENIIFKTIKVFNEKKLKALDDLVLINNWIWMAFSSKTIKISGNIYR